MVRVESHSFLVSSEEEFNSRNPLNRVESIHSLNNCWESYLWVRVTLQIMLNHSKTYSLRCYLSGLCKFYLMRY